MKIFFSLMSFYSFQIRVFVQNCFYKIRLISHSWFCSSFVRKIIQIMASKWRTTFCRRCQKDFIKIAKRKTEWIWIKLPPIMKLKTRTLIATFLTGSALSKNKIQFNSFCFKVSHYSKQLYLYTLPIASLFFWNQSNSCYEWILFNMTTKYKTDSLIFACDSYFY